MIVVEPEGELDIFARLFLKKTLRLRHSRVALHALPLFALQCIAWLQIEIGDLNAYGSVAAQNYVWFVSVLDFALGEREIPAKHFEIVPLFARCLVHGLAQPPHIFQTIAPLCAPSKRQPRAHAL